MIYVMGLFRLQSGEEQWRCVWATEHRRRAASIARVLLDEQVCFDAYVMSDQEMRRKLGAQVVVDSQVSADMFQESPEGMVIGKLVDTQLDQSLHVQIEDCQRDLRSCARELETMLQEAFHQRWSNAELTRASGFSALTLHEIRRTGHIPSL